jgi:phosphatidylethanolamine/phosphatidyl-N-methylethanolamine N-methyltransferase
MLAFPEVARDPRWKFFRQWLMHPRSVASVTPSSPELAAAMLDELPEGARRVIELGGGTGAFTRAALARGIDGADLLVLELNRELARHLHESFPQVRVLRGNACELAELPEARRFLHEGRADAVLSGLGLLSMDRETQRRILASAFACLREGGRFVQFTYGPRPPVADRVAADLGLKVRRGEFVLRNVPPATVYVYEKRDS